MDFSSLSMLTIPTSIPGLEQIPNAESALAIPSKVPTFLMNTLP